uniref:Ribonuclease P protein subunit p20 n=1 Tax=Rhipicephalus zambeziensis TaxID=60191 RepID=A0A224Z7V7_9ACAR
MEGAEAASERPATTRRPRFDPDEYQMRKRKTSKSQLPRRENDVYVNMSTNFKGQLERCRKLIDSGKTEVFVHAMGAAVGRAINLALQVESNYQGLLEMDVRTSTVGVVDDLEPLADDLEPTTQTRQTSAVHIRLFMPNAQKQE